MKKKKEPLASEIISDLRTELSLTREQYIRSRSIELVTQLAGEVAPEHLHFVLRLLCGLADKTVVEHWKDGHFVMELVDKEAKA